MNEEEIKVKVILPFLARLGLKSSDLQLETSFYLRLGRHVLDLSTGKKTGREGAGARLDILVRRNNENLFILETKELEQELTDDDRDQAISYARLVHPIAPYALVTNGKQWKLFDSVSKQEIDPNEFKLKDRYQIALPEELLAEAIVCFLGYSSENLRRFCSEQISVSLNPLMGSATELDKKFIPALHVPDEILEKELDAFLADRSTGFLIAAESGLGKTSEMCHHARRLLDSGQIVVFFQGYQVESGISTAIAEEFNWTFSEQQSPVEIFRRLQSILKDRALVVFVDAIDEWIYAQKVPNLLNFLRLAKGFPLKVVFSCKSAAWSVFAKHLGSSTGIEEFLHKVQTPDGPTASFTLRGFTQERLHAALKKYSSVFGVRAEFQDAVLREAQRNPFLLRVFFAVAKAKGLEQFTFSSSEFFDAYYQELLAKTGEPEKADAQLQAVGRVLFEQNEDGIEFGVVRTGLGLSVNEVILPKLFELNILTKSSDHNQRIGFYFQQLRDYLVAFRALRWPKFSKERFAATIKALKNEGVQADVLAFYYSHAAEQQKRAIDGPLFENASKYLRLYEQLLTKHFSSLKRCMRPGTANKIGFIAEIIISKRQLGFYGFREITNKDAEILFVPVEAFISRSNLMQMFGAGALFFAGSAKGFTTLDVEAEVIENEIERQVKELVNKKLLNEATSTGLLQETLASIVFALPDIFQECFTHPNPPLNLPFPYVRRRVLQYPLNFQKIRAAYLRRFFFDRLLCEWLSQNEGEPLTLDEERKIHQKVEEAIASHYWIQSPFRFPPFATELDIVLKALEKNGMAINEQWIERSALFNLFRANPEEGIAAAKAYLANLFSAFLENYKSLIDFNFPTLKEHFLLRSKKPVCVILTLDAAVIDAVRTGNHMGNHLQIIYSTSTKQLAKNAVLVTEKDELIGTFPNFQLKGDNFEGFYLTSDSLLSCTFSSDASVAMTPDKQTLPLHKLVYEQLQQELPDALKAFRELVGFSGRRNNSHLRS